MKTTLEETLAKIHHDKINDPKTSLSWDELPERDQSSHKQKACTAMRAVLDHLASLEAPSVEKLELIYDDADLSDWGHDVRGIEAVRNALVPPLVAKIAALEANPLNPLIDSMVNDPEHAWGWHCNIAMACYDAGARPHQACNKGAAQFLKVLSDGRVDTTTHPAYASTQNNGDHLSTPAPQVSEIPKEPHTLAKEFGYPPERFGEFIRQKQVEEKAEQNEIRQRVRAANRKAPPAIVSQMAAMSAHEKASEQVNYLVADNLSIAGHPSLSPVREEKWAAEKAAYAKGLKIEWKAQDGTGGKWAACPLPGWYEDPEIEYRIAPGQEADPYADLKAAAAAGKWIQSRCYCAQGKHWTEPTNKNPFTWNMPPEDYRVLELTTHDGKTYFKHTPGDEMPVAGDVEVCVVIQAGYSNGQGRPARHYRWNACDSGDIIGYYPTSLAEALGNVEKPQPEQDKPDDLTALEKINEQLRADNLKHIETIGGLTEEIARLKEEKTKWESLKEKYCAALKAHQDVIDEQQGSLAALTPRPVSVKPTAEDANAIGLIWGCGHDGNLTSWHYTQVGTTDELAWWLPGSLARLAPELLPKVEDKERAEFERRFPGLPLERSEAGVYTNWTTDKMWQAWQARAGKDASK